MHECIYALNIVYNGIYSSN